MLEALWALISAPPIIVLLVLIAGAVGYVEYRDRQKEK